LPASAALRRALFDVLLVVEDPAASVHNPTYAARLLDEAQTALDPHEKPGAIVARPHRSASRRKTAP
jgi:hypothetical protein